MTKQPDVNTGAKEVALSKAPCIYAGSVIETDFEREGNRALFSRQVFPSPRVSEQGLAQFMAGCHKF